ncbi:LIM domain only protein 3 isoform X3 [Sus scrofa]|uniref:LIM domain only protein 3 isoform X3 n=1 Tax=Sus scrofa TaxID=9823 RepID=UPI0003AF1F71|nr:LIM domain only protein 3 isoform X3 [Sus scrofa]
MQAEDVDGRRESRAAAARNVSSTTRVDNSQSSRGTAAFPHPRLPGREGRGEFGRRRSLRPGPARRKGDSVLGIQMLSVQPDTKPKGCAGCNRKIKDRYLLKALDKYWHEDCLKCACCDCRLGEVGSTLYTKANLILCRRDYLRLFGVTGNCAACSKLIPAFEMVMRAKDNVYHLDCFACQLCNQRFCVGDKFFLKNNMILCQTDYEEGLMKEGYAPQVR